MSLACCLDWVIRRTLAAAVLVQQTACTDRSLDGTTQQADPADERTNDEVLRDFCELYVRCEVDQPVLDWPMCLWYFDFIITDFEMDPDKPPECAEAIWDEMACASKSVSCEDFTASWFRLLPTTNHRCDEPFERFDAADCASR